MLLTTPNWLRWCSRAMRVEKMSKLLWSCVLSWQKLLIWRFFAIPKCMCFCFVVWCSLFASFFGVWIFPFFCFLFLRFPLVMLWQLQIGWDDVLELWGLKRWGSFNDPVLFLCHELLIWSVFLLSLHVFVFASPFGGLFWVLLQIIVSVLLLFVFESFCSSSRNPSRDFGQTKSLFSDGFHYYSHAYRVCVCHQFAITNSA